MDDPMEARGRETDASGISVASHAELVERNLFGGAITATTRPGLVDASDVRQVPDTQEVFMYPDSGVSIIVEILQQVEPVDLEEAIKFHFDSLKHDNDAEEATEPEVTYLSNFDGQPNTPPPIILFGAQSVAKFNSKMLDQVQIFMALVRVEKYRSDIVITFNVPVVAADNKAVGLVGADVVRGDFESFVRSFCIRDYSLFA